MSLYPYFSVEFQNKCVFEFGFVFVVRRSLREHLYASANRFDKLLGPTDILANNRNDLRQVTMPTLLDQ